MIVLDSKPYPVCVTNGAATVLLKTLASLLAVSPRSISDRLERASLGHLMSQASDGITTALRAARVCGLMERQTRMLDVADLAQLPEGFARNEQGALDELVAEVNGFLSQDGDEEFVDDILAVPVSPKDKAARKAVMPSLKPSVRLLFILLG